MARLVLSQPGEDVRIGGNVQVAGTVSGGEVITVIDGTVTLDGSFTAGGDTVILSGQSTSYTVELVGSRVLITDGNNQVSIPVGTAGILVQFDDSTSALKINSAAGAVVIGDQVITSVPTPIGDDSSSSILVLDEDTVMTFDNNAISGFSTIVLATGRDGDSADGHQYVLELDNDNAPISGNILTIDGSALAGDTDGSGPLAAESVYLDAYLSTFSLNITLGAANDAVYGGEGNDVIKMGAGNDIVIGYLGADILTGGSGSDSFVYDTEFDSTLNQGRDQITDFQTGSDQIIAATLAIFEFAGNYGSYATASNALIANDYIIDIVYQQDQNLLWADLDDNGVLSGSDFSAVLEGVNLVSDGDFGFISDYGTNFIYDYENNDDFENAQIVNRDLFDVSENYYLTDSSLPSLEIRGTISDNNDIDIFRIYLEAGETLILDVDDSYDPDVLSNLDSYIAVADFDGNYLAENDDAFDFDEGSSFGLDSFLEFTAPADGYYHFGIGSFENGTPGGVPEIYHLLVSIEPPSSAPL